MKKYKEPIIVSLKFHLSLVEMLHPDVILNRIMLTLKFIEPKKVLPEPIKPFQNRTIYLGINKLQMK